MNARRIRIFIIIFALLISTATADVYMEGCVMHEYEGCTDSISSWGSCVIGTLIDFCNCAANFMLAGIKEIILLGPDVGVVKPMVDDLIRTLIPLYVMAIMLTSIYLVFLSTSPSGRMKAKSAFLRLILSMVLVTVSLEFFVMLLSVSDAISMQLLSKAILSGEAGIIIMGPGGVLLFLLPSGLLVIFMVAALISIAFNYLLILMMAALFPLTLFLYFFDLTRSMGAKMLKYTLMSIFTQVTQALLLAIMVIILNNMGVHDIWDQVILMLAACVCFALMAIAPLIMLGVMQWIGGAVAGIGMAIVFKNPKLGGLMMAGGGVAAGMGPEALAAGGAATVLGRGFATSAVKSKSMTQLPGGWIATPFGRVIHKPIARVTVAGSRAVRKIPGKADTFLSQFDRYNRGKGATLAGVAASKRAVRTRVGNIDRRLDQRDDYRKAKRLSVKTGGYVSLHAKKGIRKVKAAPAWTKKTIKESPYTIKKGASKASKGIGDQISKRSRLGKSLVGLARKHNPGQYLWHHRKTIGMSLLLGPTYMAYKGLSVGAVRLLGRTKGYNPIIENIKNLDLRDSENSRHKKLKDIKGVLRSGMSADEINAKVIRSTKMKGLDGTTMGRLTGDDVIKSTTPKEFNTIVRGAKREAAKLPDGDQLVKKIDKINATPEQKLRNEFKKGEILDSRTKKFFKEMEKEHGKLDNTNHGVYKKKAIQFFKDEGKAYRLDHVANKIKDIDHRDPERLKKIEKLMTEGDMSVKDKRELYSKFRGEHGAPSNYKYGKEDNFKKFRDEAAGGIKAKRENLIEGTYYDKVVRKGGDFLLRSLALPGYFAYHAHKGALKGAYGLGAGTSSKFNLRKTPLLGKRIGTRWDKSTKWLAKTQYSAHRKLYGAEQSGFVDEINKINVTNKSQVGKDTCNEVEDILKSAGVSGEEIDTLEHEFGVREKEGTDDFKNFRKYQKDAISLLNKKRINEYGEIAKTAIGGGARGIASAMVAKERFIPFRDARVFVGGTIKRGSDIGSYVAGSKRVRGSLDWAARQKVKVGQSMGNSRVVQGAGSAIGKGAGSVVTVSKGVGSSISGTAGGVARWVGPKVAFAGPPLKKAGGAIKWTGKSGAGVGKFALKSAVWAGKGAGKSVVWTGKAAGKSIAWTGKSALKASTKWEYYVPVVGEVKFARDVYSARGDISSAARDIVPSRFNTAQKTIGRLEGAKDVDKMRRIMKGDRRSRMIMGDVMTDVDRDMRGRITGMEKRKRYLEGELGKYNIHPPGERSKLRKELNDVRNEIRTANGTYNDRYTEGVRERSIQVLREEALMDETHPNFSNDLFKKFKPAGFGKRNRGIKGVLKRAKKLGLPQVDMDEINRSFIDDKTNLGEDRAIMNANNRVNHQYMKEGEFYNDMDTLGKKHGLGDDQMNSIKDRFKVTRHETDNLNWETQDGLDKITDVNAKAMYDVHENYTQNMLAGIAENSGQRDLIGKMGLHIPELPPIEEPSGLYETTLSKYGVTDERDIANIRGYLDKGDVSHAETLLKHAGISRGALNEIDFARDWDNQNYNALYGKNYQTTMRETLADAGVAEDDIPGYIKDTRRAVIYGKKDKAAMGIFDTLSEMGLSPITNDFMGHMKKSAEDAMGEGFRNLGNQLHARMLIEDYMGIGPRPSEFYQGLSGGAKEDTEGEETLDDILSGFGGDEGSHDDDEFGIEI